VIIIKLAFQIHKLSVTASLSSDRVEKLPLMLMVLLNSAVDRGGPAAREAENQKGER
jgi:hypothetical protein